MQKQDLISPKIRLLVAPNLLKSSDASFEISGGDFEYLSKVMRQKVGDFLSLFDGKNGEFLGQIIAIHKKSLQVTIKTKLAKLQQVPNISLAFALVKNIRIDYLAAKATELGVRSFQPLLTQHCVVDRFNSQRFFANIKEACEQCGRNDLPIIKPLINLEKFLKSDHAMQGRRLFGEKKIIPEIQRIPIYQSSLKLEQNPALEYQGTPQCGDAGISARKNLYRNPKDSGIKTTFPQVSAESAVEMVVEDRDFEQVLEENRQKKIVLFCDESGTGKQASKLLPEIAAKAEESDFEIQILIGPEGGFSASEFAALRASQDCFALSLGPRILRADTAALVALALVQEFLGDFHKAISNH
jgi:16S rRNA (uracil1498-N3)-methyltransferase